MGKKIIKDEMIDNGSKRILQDSLVNYYQCFHVLVSVQQLGTYATITVVLDGVGSPTCYPNSDPPSTPFDEPWMTRTPQSLLSVPPHFFPHGCWSLLDPRHARSIQTCCVQTARVLQSFGPTPPSWSRRKNNVSNSCAARPFSAGKESRRPATGRLVRRII